MLPQEWERWVASGGRKQDHPATQAAAAAAALGVQGVPVSKSAAARMKLSLEELAKRGSHMADL